MGDAPKLLDRVREAIRARHWATAERAFYMLYAYSKNEQEDLTPAQARMLGQLVREEFK